MVLDPERQNRYDVEAEVADEDLINCGLRPYLATEYVAQTTLAHTYPLMWAIRSMDLLETR